MAKLHLVGVIDCIAHDWNQEISTIWVRVGEREIKIERPMTQKFAWVRNIQKGETIQSGDTIEITMRTTMRGSRR